MVLMCVDCVLASPRIAQVDLDDEPLPEVVLSQGLFQNSAIPHMVQNRMEFQDPNLACIMPL
jgi:hypothetical protein